MTESLFQKLEEKIIVLLTELETLRAELNTIKRDNAAFAAEKADASRKLQELILLLDVTETTQQSAAPIKSEYAA